MDMMNRIIITVQSAAIPILAVIMAVIVFNMMKKPGATTADSEEKFKVKESKFWLVISVFGILSAAIFIWLALTNTTEGQIVIAYVLAAACLIASGVTAYVYNRRYLVVDGKTLIYQPLKGQAQTFEARLIGKMEIIQSPRCEELKVYNRSGKQLFEIQGYMVNSQVLKKYMRNLPVKIVKKEYDEAKK